jgi:hypothetical protein
MGHFSFCTRGPRARSTSHAGLRRSSLWLALVVSAGCADDPPFQSLSSLCADLAEDICSVRVGGCCAGTDPVTCNSSETARCNTQLAALTGENVYEFDAVEAAHTRETSRRQLDLCGSAPPLVSFFKGGLPNDAPCERDSQCSAGSCAADRRVCAAVTPAPLCTVQP